METTSSHKRGKSLLELPVDDTSSAPYNTYIYIYVCSNTIIPRVWVYKVMQDLHHQQLRTDDGHEEVVGLPQVTCGDLASQAGEHLLELFLRDRFWVAIG